MSTLETISDPRKIKTIALYKDPNSETFGNLKQSALRAGYSIGYADTLSAVKPDWLTENIQGDVQSIIQAEKNLRKYNDYKLDPEDIETKRDVEIAKLQLNSSMFILKTQAKGKYNDEQVPIAPHVQVNIINYNKDNKKDEDNTVIDVETHDVPSTPQE